MNPEYYGQIILWFIEGVVKTAIPVSTVIVAYKLLNVSR